MIKDKNLNQVAPDMASTFVNVGAFTYKNLAGLELVSTSKARALGIYIDNAKFSPRDASGTARPANNFDAGALFYKQ